MYVIVVFTDTELASCSVENCVGMGTAGILW